MTTSTRAALSGFMLLLATAPSFAQGVFETPPAPNSSQSMPQPPDSAPLSARTLPPGSTGMEQVGTVGTAHLQPAPAAATTPAASSTNPVSAQAPAGSATSARRIALGHLDNAEASIRAGRVSAAENSMENAETVLLNQEMLLRPGEVAKAGPLPEHGALRQVTVARTALQAGQAAAARKDAETAIVALRTALLQAEQPK